MVSSDKEKNNWTKPILIGLLSATGGGGITLSAAQIQPLIEKIAKVETRLTSSEQRINRIEDRWLRAVKEKNETLRSIDERLRRIENGNHRR